MHLPMIAFQSFSYESLVVYALRQKGATTDTTGGVPLFAVKIFLQVSTIL